MQLTDKEQTDLLDEIPSTNKIARAVVLALQALGMNKIPKDIERIWKIAEKIDRRTEANWNADAARYKVQKEKMPTAENDV